MTSEREIRFSWLPLVAFISEQRTTLSLIGQRPEPYRGPKMRGAGFDHSLFEIGYKKDENPGNFIGQPSHSVELRFQQTILKDHLRRRRSAVLSG